MRMRRSPSIGSIVLLVLLVVALASGGDDEAGTEGDRDRGERRERAERKQRADKKRSGARRGRERSRPARTDRGGPGGAPAGGVVAPVVDVVDGDTIEVALGGGVEDVRYIGIDTPESVAPGQPVECFGKEASAANERLVAGEDVRLVYDAERRDRYGRLLAYVYLERDGTFVNAALVRRGFAQTLTIPPNDRFAALFDRLEQAAANAGRGLWRACG